MTERAWITSGAERSAPRSHSGASTPDVHRVAHTGANLVAPHRQQLAPLVLDSKPPHTWLELERYTLTRGRARAQRRAPHLGTALACSAVESDTETISAPGRARDRRHAAAEARAMRRRTTTQPVACLTSARRHGHALDVRVELASVGRTPTIGRGHGACVAVEGGTLLLKGGAE